jgi:hypothetical protein
MGRQRREMTAAKVTLRSRCSECAVRCCRFQTSEDLSLARSGLSKSSLAYRRSALPAAIAAQGCVYDAIVEEIQHIYDICLATLRL